MTNSFYCSEFLILKCNNLLKNQQVIAYLIIAYLIWKGSYNWFATPYEYVWIIAYLIWKGSYNGKAHLLLNSVIIAYLIWKGSYNCG